MAGEEQGQIKVKEEEAMKRMMTSVVAGAAALLLAGEAMAQAPSFQSVLEGARKEGALVVWVSSPGRPETHKALFDAFNKRFNLNIRAEWSPASSVQTGPRVIAEQARGQGTIDIVGAGGAEEASVLLERQLIKAYPWKEVFGAELPKIGEVADRAMGDLRGIALPILDAVYGVAWNTDLIKDEEVPEKYTDLLDPKWRNKIVVNAFFMIPLDTTSFVVGRDQTFEMAKKLVDNRPILERGTPAVSRAISVGQAPIGVTTFHAAARSGTPEKPQKFKLFADYIPVIPTYVYMPENAPHPNAARLFMAWLVTEGTAIANQFELTPQIADTSSELGKMAQARMAAGAKIASPNSLQQVKNAESLRQDIAKLIADQPK